MDFFFFIFLLSIKIRKCFYTQKGLTIARPLNGILFNYSALTPVSDSNSTCSHPVSLP